MNSTRIFQFIGFIVVGKLVYGAIFSVVGQIPAVKRFNEKKAQEMNLVHEARDKASKERVKSQFTLEPLQAKYGSLLNTYQNVQFPVIGPSFSSEDELLNSSSFAYDSESRCQWAKKVWSVFIKEKLSCSSPQNS